jgi:hypothetical protein
VSDKNLRDADLDAAVIRALSRLPSLSPRPGFEDRVMSRVRLPEPKSVVLFTRAVRWAREPRRAMVLAGGYALSAAAALVVLIPWLFRNVAALQVGGNWALAQVSALWAQTTALLANWAVTSGTAGWFASLGLGSGTLLAAAGVLTAAYAGCAALLHFLLRAPRGTDATAPASL